MYTDEQNEHWTSNDDEINESDAKIVFYRQISVLFNEMKNKTIESNHIYYTLFPIEHTFMWTFHFWASISLSFHMYLGRISFWQCLYSVLVLDRVCSLCFCSFRLRWLQHVRPYDAVFHFSERMLFCPHKHTIRADGRVNRRFLCCIVLCKSFLLFSTIIFPTIFFSTLMLFLIVHPINNSKLLNIKT